MNEDNEIDQLFKDRLSDPEIPFNEMNWEKMERMLDGKTKKRVIPLWVYTACGIAAVLLISLYLIFLAPVSSDQQLVKDPLTSSAVKPGKGFVPLTAVDSLKAPGVEVPVTEKSAGIQNRYTTDPIDFSVARMTPVFSGTSVSLARSAENKGIATTLPLVGNVSPLLDFSSMVSNPITPVLAPATTIAANSKTKPAVPAVETDSAILVRKANALAQSKDPFERVEASEIARSVKNKMEKALQPQNDLILSAMAAPDMSFAKSSKPSKVSSNVGVLATYAFTSKISMTSGAVYARKFYNSGNSGNSGGGGNWANTTYVPGSDWQVNADCNVLDIPLNVNYKIFNKKKLSVSLNTGVSSYFMLKEKYQITTGQGAAAKVTNLEIDNENQHLFGIANVSVSFDHQLTPSVSVGVQPFAKLPLTGIGYGDASLKSAGVSFSLNIGLFPAKKPGKYAAVRY
ncbi:hypothetical protein AY601_4923 [Pedobacter cryoconitis]|uniref:Outer membrane protein beta-barrel domain-containing protein n=1 Tax=Pedobacter cryoconitis TaxID=188932 RepID=A0A127VKB2_9SPHI|nr:hypothetical protein [Pedobacter cryoconitis]AMQ01743.1 hypothetical protein AY601_4923 [Pedobacter cryoconitis]